MNSPRTLLPKRFLKTPLAIYSLTVVFFGIAILNRHFPHGHQGVEDFFLNSLFWLLNVGTLLIGVAWWKDKKYATGGIGLVLALGLAVLFFTV